jgi:hypothetical protein
MLTRGKTSKVFFEEKKKTEKKQRLESEAFNRHQSSRLEHLDRMTMIIREKEIL